MADETQVAAPPAPAPEAAPAVPEQPQTPSGIEAAMKDFEAVTTPKPKEAALAKPDAKAEPAKPEAKPVTGKPEAAPAKAEKADIWSKAPGNLKGEHFKTVRQLETKISDYEKRIKEIESKPKETQADTKLVEDYQKRIADYEKKVAALDFRSSEAFKKEHTERINAEYQDHIKEVASLRIHSKDADGVETTRPATKEDFDRLFSLPPAERDAAIATFGPSVYTVAGMYRSLVGMTRASERAIADHAAKAELLAKEQSLKADREKGEYQIEYDNAIKSLETHYPQYFAKDENDPEASEALANGYKYVDNILSKMDAMTQKDRAEYNAVIRARVAGFARSTLDNNRLRTEVESLKEELAKYRKSDPGSGEGDKGAAIPGPDPDIPNGIEAAAVLMAKG